VKVPAERELRHPEGIESAADFFARTAWIFDGVGNETSAKEVEVIAALPVISAATFAGVAPPERKWIVQDMIPDRAVTIVAGDGGGGKTTLLLQLGIAIAGIRPWLGHNPDHGPVLIVTAEDDEEEIHRRLAAIAKSLGVELSDLAKLHIVPLAGEDAVMGTPEGTPALIAPTAVFRGLVALVERIKPRVVILDALADVYAGEENARVQARQFVGLLRSLAIKNDLAVVLVAHWNGVGQRDKRFHCLEQLRTRAALPRAHPR
jgi:RecA-family ATPase